LPRFVLFILSGFARFLFTRRPLLVVLVVLVLVLAGGFLPLSLLSTTARVQGPLCA
jgi:hypothetical protein